MTSTNNQQKDNCHVQAQQKHYNEQLWDSIYGHGVRDPNLSTKKKKLPFGFKRQHRNHQKQNSSNQHPSAVVSDMNKLWGATYGHDMTR